MLQKNIRNFCIIAHIDHGKSTLADRLLEITKTVPKRIMKDQFLDNLELERERGITIKLQPVRLEYRDYILNLIDTPGHIDFNYEVSRSLAAVEGALLVVDATQGIQAQTLANLYLAINENLTIIPLINKIDLKQADIEGTRKDLIKILGCRESDIILISAKTGQNTEQVLEAIIQKIPPPKGHQENKTQALIFDSKYDEYQGVIVYLKVVNGILKKGDKIKFIASGQEAQILDLGYFKPEFVSSQNLQTGEIGYLTTGLKEITKAKVGDTITLSENPAIALKGYQQIKPMVYAGIFCQGGNDYQKLKEAIEKLKLNDAALIYEPENSKSLGFGFRCGLLGLLHLEIFQERLKREFNLNLIITSPSVAYKVKLKNQQEKIIKNPQDYPAENLILETTEPIMRVEIISPRLYQGPLMQLTQIYGGQFENLEYLDSQKCILKYSLPLASLIIDFYDKIKSVSAGYASVNYEFVGYQKVDLVKLDILIAGNRHEALANLIRREKAYETGRRMVETLKKVIPKKLFEIKIQAAIGGKIIAAEKIPALRKDVIAKLYGGDITRKKKLLEKQKKGKKRMKNIGSINLPSEAFLIIFKKL